MDTFLIKAAQLILALAILVIIHEFGHFIFARIFGISVEKFFIFFNPLTSLFKWRPGKYVAFLGRKRHTDPALDALEAQVSEGERRASEAMKEAREKTASLRRRVSDLRWRRLVTFSSAGRDRIDAETAEAEARIAETEAGAEKLAREAYAARSLFEETNYYDGKDSLWKRTEYGIGWLPLGGYCKIAGMIDESMDRSQMELPPKKWEFRSKPAWQRLLVMVAGVLFNFLLAILIYAGIVYATGEKYVPFGNARMGMVYSEAARQAGFRDGDIPLSADGEALGNPAEGRMKMIQAKEVTVLRDGRDTVRIAIPDKFIFRLEEEAKSGKAEVSFMAYRTPVRITQTMPGEGADKAGLKPGDEVVAIDGRETPALDLFMKELARHPGETVRLTVVRPASERSDTLSLPVTLSENARMGVGLEVDPAAFFDFEEKRYGLLESVPRGVEMGVDRLTAYASSMKLVFTREGAQSIGGFGALGSIFPEKWNWIAFWNIAAFLSVVLAFMNILPIPALDGGHVMFLLYEVITRRKPSEKVMEYGQMAGMILLILLLLYANGMDIVRLFK